MDTDNFATLPYLDSRVYQVLRAPDGKCLPHIVQSNNAINFLNLEVNTFEKWTKHDIDVHVEQLKTTNQHLHVYYLYTYEKLKEEDDPARVMIYRGTEIRAKTEEERMQPIIVQGDTTEEAVTKARLDALRRNAVKEQFVLVAPFHPEYMVDVIVAYAPETAVRDEVYPAAPTPADDAHSEQPSEHQEENSTPDEK